MPPKTYEAPHEKDQNGGFTGHLMSDGDKDVNRRLATMLFNDWLKGTPAKTLDIGSKYPYLAHCLKVLGCEAFGMDNIEVVPEYSRDLDVPMLMADFEVISEDQIHGWTTEKFSLITMVHVFEHMYEPLEALRKLRKLIADDGTLFIRLPDHATSGFERDLTASHYTIHPFFHSLSSLLELLVQGQDLFTVQLTYPMNGSGQRDLMLKPITRKPTVFAGLIVKNEARDLPRCLKSIEDLVDGVVIVDTGSTDETLEVAQQTIGKPVYTQVYTGASRQDETGDWKIWDFGKARNVFVKEIEERGADYVLWMDGDDELLTPNNLRRALYWSQYDVFGLQLDSGGNRWVHHRLWKTGRGIHYEGRCHEYPTIGACPSITLGDSVVRHHAEPGAGENSNARNLRILLEEFQEIPGSRTAFYLANTFKDASRYAEAVPWYDIRITMGVGYRDEWIFAHLYKARCQRAAGDLNAAKLSLLRGTAQAPDWCEFWMELAYLENERGAFRDAIGYAMIAVDKPQPPCELWREANKYTDQPPRIISWCYEHLRDNTNALAWAMRAREQIGEPDEEWDERIARLHAMAGDRRPSELNPPRAVLTGDAPKVLLAILARDKASCLDLYLKCIKALDYPKDRIHLYIRTNNNSDSTPEILKSFIEKHGGEYASVEFDDTEETPQLDQHRHHDWNGLRFKVLGKIRNGSLAKTLERGCDFYFVVDCDNFVLPHTLRKIVSYDLPIVAPLLAGDRGDLYANFHYDIDENGYYKDHPIYRDIFSRTVRGVIEVKVVHCTYLVRADAITGLTYDDGSGRYEYVIFSDSARKSGIPQYIDNTEMYGILTFNTERAQMVDFEAKYLSGWLPS